MTWALWINLEGVTVHCSKPDIVAKGLDFVEELGHEGNWSRF